MMRLLTVLSLGLLAGCEGASFDELAAGDPGPITDSPPETGAITLSWQPPTENTDGSPLTDLAGYVIHYGQSSGSYEREIRVENPGLTRYMVEGLQPGTYYLAATSFNTNGLESPFSGEIVSRVN